MLRIVSIALLLLAYLAGTNHCAITEMFCESNGYAAHAKCQHHAGKHHDGQSAATQEANCDLDKTLSTAPSLLSLIEILLGAGVLLFSLFIWRHLWCISALSTPATPPVYRPDRLLALAQRWQFVQRAAGFARSPSLVA